jgi:hypothetical protein
MIVYLLGALLTIAFIAARLMRRKGKHDLYNIIELFGFLVVFVSIAWMASNGGRTLIGDYVCASGVVLVVVAMACQIWQTNGKS